MRVPPAATDMKHSSELLDDKHMAKIKANFTRLKDKCYLDSAGAALYPEALVRAVHAELATALHTNPHSDARSARRVAEARAAVLAHFGTDARAYTVVFTAGATHALKLVAEAFRFHEPGAGPQRRGAFVHLRDNHTSVLGLRAIAAQRGAEVVPVSHAEFVSAMSDSHPRVTEGRERFKYIEAGNNLFVYPAQSNFNGYKYRIDRMEDIRGGHLSRHVKSLSGRGGSWHVLLDAAAYVSASALDLSETQPDFVVLSFYKIFGYPTGLGALLVKNTSRDMLNQRQYYGGGTIDVVLSGEDFYAKKQNFYESMEDGTVSFLAIAALAQCFASLRALLPRAPPARLMHAAALHTLALARRLYLALGALAHANGHAAAVLYADSDYSDVREQGGTVTFNLLRDDGSYIGYTEFQRVAEASGVLVRTGCFCNSGACQRLFGVSSAEVKRRYRGGHACGDDMDVIDGEPTGAVRASFGYYNTPRDVDTLLHMIRRHFLQPPANWERQVRLLPPCRFHDPWLP